MRTLLCIFSLDLLFAFSANGQAVLYGTVRDDVEVLVGATVKMSQNGKVIKGTVTDIDGNYKMGLEAGTYEVSFSYTGFDAWQTDKVVVVSEKVSELNAVLKPIKNINFHGCGSWKVPLISETGEESAQTFTAEQIRHMY